jgi:hypothetical protein
MSESLIHSWHSVVGRNPRSLTSICYEWVTSQYLPNMVMLQLCVVLYKDSLLRTMSLIIHESDERTALRSSFVNEYFHDFSVINLHNMSTGLVTYLPISSLSKRMVFYVANNPTTSTMSAECQSHGPLVTFLQEVQFCGRKVWSLKLPKTLIEKTDYSHLNVDAFDPETEYFACSNLPAFLLFHLLLMLVRYTSLDMRTFLFF